MFHISKNKFPIKINQDVRVWGESKMEYKPYCVTNNITALKRGVGAE